MYSSAEFVDHPNLSEEAELLVYKNMEESGSVNVVLKDNDIWATQVAMTELFGVDRYSISKHIRNIYSESELEGNSTIAKIAIVQTEGDHVIKREIDHYSLDMIISVGYRVNSQRATNFRIWATRILKEYTIKGFVLDYASLEGEDGLFLRLQGDGLSRTEQFHCLVCNFVLIHGFLPSGHT